MVRLHVVHHEEIDAPVPYFSFDVSDEFGSESCRSSVNQCNLFIYNEIRVVRYTFREAPLVLEQTTTEVIDSHVSDVF